LVENQRENILKATLSGQKSEMKREYLLVLLMTHINIWMDASQVRTALMMMPTQIEVGKAYVYILPCNFSYEKHHVYV
jgi:hypothetical protein